MNMSWPTVLIIAAITGTVFGFVAFGYTTPDVSSQESDDKIRTIKISGDASRSLEADQVTIFMTIQGEPADATAAIAAQQTAIEDVRQAIESTGTNSTVKVGSISLSPPVSFSYGSMFWNEEPEPVPADSSFTVTARIPVKIPLDELPAVAEELADAEYEISEIFTYTDYFYDDDGEVDSVEYVAELVVVISAGPAPLDEAVSQYEEKFQNLTSTLEQIGIPSEDVVPSEINTEPAGADGQPSTSGDASYQAYSSIIVTAAMEDIDEVVAAAQAAGATPQNVLLSVSDARMEEARKELTLEALDNARGRAADVAESLGMQVKDVLSIDVTTGPNTSSSYSDLYQILLSSYQQSQGTELIVTVTAEFEIG
jgi:uncharacterized protein YggE